MTLLQTQLTTALPTLKWQLDEPLAPRTYAKIGGPAEAFVRIHTPEDASTLFSYCHNHAIHLTVLGGASNVIVPDEGLRGVVAQYVADTVKLLDTKSSDGNSLVYVSSGAKTALAVSQTVALGLTGLEYFLGVPGTIGGAIYNNAHYLTDLIDQHIHRVHALSVEGIEQWYSHADCQFKYEHSRFQESTELILGAEFSLAQGTPEESRQKIAHATKYRADTQPLGIPSSGCMFRNPPNSKKLRTLFPQFADKQFIPAGFLIDQAGLKGKRVGGVSVSEKHAAWIVNHGAGTSADVSKLVDIISEQIVELYDVELETEVFFLSADTGKVES